MAHIGFPPNPKKRNYRNPDAIEKLVKYILRQEKTPDDVVGARGVLFKNQESIIEDMLLIQRHYRKCNGRRAVHFYVAFSDEESEVITHGDYLKIGYLISDIFDGYQLVFALHQDTDNLHIHFGINPVNYYTGKKLPWKKKDTIYLKEKVDSIIKNIIS